MARIKISAPDASHYPFSFQLGDVVEVLRSGNLMQGKITDAEYEGPPKENKGGELWNYLYGRI
jgi:hypothetical protein